MNRLFLYQVQLLMSIYTVTIGEIMRFIFVVVILLWCCVATSFAAPELAVDSSLIDWGSVYSGEKREHLFILKNVGDSPLEIKQVKSSCGCTAAVLSSKIIPSGGRSELRVRFNSKNFRGHVSKKVYVVSDDPQEPKKVFTLRASVISELEVRPSRLSLGAIGAGKAVERTVTFVNRSDIAINLKAVRSTSRSVSLSNYPESLLPGQEVLVTVTVHPTSTGKSVLNGYLLIDAQGHTRNQLRIPVMAKVVR